MSQTKKKISVITLGCKLNYAESSSLINTFLQKGYEQVELIDKPDLVVVHTCSVTQNANQKCRQSIRSVIKKTPNSFVAVIGCYAQLEPQTLASIEGVDLILGAQEKFNLNEYIPQSLKKNKKPAIAVTKIEDAYAFGIGHSIIEKKNHSSRTRAFLKIQDGCDYGCAFCTIPLARGKARSQSIEACKIQAQQLIDAGYQEIVLTGVNIGEYGSDFGASLNDLIQAFEDLKIPRLRISSIEPNLLTTELIKSIANSKHVVPHFHVPLQSGSDDVLKKMKRRYSTNIYKERIQEAVKHIPNCSIGADLIVGFPGEEQHHIEEAYSFINGLPISYLHVFTYSRRKNTLADQWIEKKLVHEISSQEKKRRSELFLNLSNQKKTDFIGKYIGGIKEILFEENFKNLEQENQVLLCIGHTDNYISVGVEVPSKVWAKSNLVGKILPVKLKQFDSDDFVTGQLL